MTVAYHLRGYDKASEFLAVEYDIPADLLPWLKGLVVPAPDDPELIDPYELASHEVQRLAEALALSIDPIAFDYCVEADEDPVIVAALRDAVRAGA